MQLSDLRQQENCYATAFCAEKTFRLPGFSANAECPAAAPPEGCFSGISDTGFLVLLQGPGAVTPGRVAGRAG
ncbi:hypothetical protein HOY34_00230 [Xinfangfangia sp. D13-10-4-6]|uniref:hypothetical protein n=1 Tax=Pseudogemmobacter hezensis TaxID=2737662 RepID=UPI001557721D|nr:hypothetical protein [Pseudogemmobacter hezensis]NPD13626.1 hypothetical protein [Pseudogemmobacter hezensis]